MSVILEYAGAERRFRLGWGQVMDLEEACGKVAIGALYKRLHAWDFRAGDIYQIVRLALIGGGLDAREAKKLVAERFDILPLSDHVNIALQVIGAMMDGAPEAKAASAAAAPEPIDRGRLYHVFSQSGITPAEVDAMSVAQALHLFAGAAASAGDRNETGLDDGAFERMQARVESGALDWALQPAAKAA